MGREPLDLRLWLTCMALFVGVDLAVIVSIAAGTGWFT